MAEKQLLDWAAKQPAWARDAIRRHAESTGFIVSDNDKAGILARVRHAAGFASEGLPDHAPVAAEHLNFGPSTAPSALLCSLGPVANLGRLAPGQQLRFALDGITLIYGDNGSGKSGYCRITKKLCRSLTVDDLLGDIFTEGAKPPAEVLVRYRLKNGEAVIEHNWIDGAVPPEPVRNISVFDSRNARFYVDKQNRIGFLPAAISLLERHGALRSEMDKEFQTELKKLEALFKVALPSGFTPGGTVAALIAKMAVKAATLPTSTELTGLGAWTEADDAELKELEKSLATDPVALAQRCKRAIAALDPLVDALDGIGNGLGESVGDALREKAEAAAAAVKAASLAAGDAFANEPLAGVGQDPWRKMYDHAKAYIASIGGGDDLPSDDGDACGLCQQPLGPEASARVKRFSAFVAGEAAKEADAARAALNAAVEAVKSVGLPGSLGQSLGEFQSMSDARREFGKQLIAAVSAAAARKAALIAGSDNGDFTNVPALADPLGTALAGELAALKEEQKKHEVDGAEKETRAKSVARRDSLKDRQLLNQTLATFEARLADLQTYQNYKQCSALVGTQALSTLITSIRRKLVTDGLETRIRCEIEGLDLAHIPFVVSDQSKDGNSLFEVSIDAPVAAANDKILSEGEQRALALASFLAEIAPDTENNGLIVDDPVSSLDHLRIRRVARRLVAEAKKGRQVVIFTHNLVFYNEVIDAAAQDGVALARRLISKTEGEGFGVVTEEDVPWIAKKTTDRIAHLRELHKALGPLTDYNSDEYRRAVRDFYTELRETWERLVEELLLGRVIERLDPGVKTQSLKLVTVEDTDYEKVFHAMKHASERSGHDMAAGKNIPAPKPDDIKADIENIDEYRQAVHKRSKAVEAKRKTLEGPPKADVA